MGKESYVYGQKHNRNATDDDVDNNKHFFEIQFKQSSILETIPKSFSKPGHSFCFPGLHIESGGNFNGKYNSNLSRKKCQVPFKYVSIFVKD